MVTLNTIEEVILHLGGVKAVQELTGRGTASAVTNWALRNSFPSNAYVTMKAALEAKGCTAPAELWGMKVRERA